MTCVLGTFQEAARHLAADLWGVGALEALHASAYYPLLCEQPYIVFFYDAVHIMVCVDSAGVHA